MPPQRRNVLHETGRQVFSRNAGCGFSGDLRNKLEAVRLVCQETGCAQRYLTQDALNVIGQVSSRIDDARGR